jgi:hypothetical protein
MNNKTIKKKEPVSLGTAKVPVSPVSTLCFQFTGSLQLLLVPKTEHYKSQKCSRDKTLKTQHG